MIQSLLGASGGIPALIGDGVRGDGAALEHESAELVAVVRDLVGLPRADFKTRLKAELERSANMTSTNTAATQAETGAKPKYRTVTPYLAIQRTEECLEFVQRTFGAVLTAHSAMPNGALHAEVRIGDSPVMIGGPGDNGPGPFFPAMLHVRVASCDETYRRALAAGGTSLSEPRDMEYGERSAGVRDTSGNQWYIAQPFLKSHWLPEMSDVTPYLHPKSAATVIDFAKRAFGATELQREVSGGVVHHAKLRIGNSVIEMSDAREVDAPALPTMLYMYVDGAASVNAWYDGALAAGATTLAAPTLAPYGDFVGSVEDPSGNRWYIAAPAAARPSADAGATTGKGANAPKTDSTVSYIRKGFRTLTPYLIVKDAVAEIDWMKAGLGATEKFRVAPGVGEKIMHAELRVADNVVELSDATSEFPARATMNMLYVADPDAAYTRALAAGATSMYPVSTKPWGDRDGVVVSPGGVTWCLTSRGPGEHITSDTPSLVTAFTADNANAYVDFMKRAFGAVEVFAHRAPNGALVHGRVRIGNSILGGGDTHGGPSDRSAMPFLMHMYIPDVDAAYAAALAAGATTVRPLEDAPYGDRTATVLDPFGNLWSLATHVRDVKF